MLGIPSIILIKVFITNENYTFLFLNNCLNQIALLYCLFLFWIVHSRNLKKTLLAFGINILILNASVLILSFLTFDSYSNFKLNTPIITELNHSLKKVKSYPGYPYSLLKKDYLKSGKTDYFIGFINNDTVTFYDQNHIDVYKDLARENAFYLDSLHNNLHFQRNRKALGELSDFFKLIPTYFDYPPCDTCLVEVKPYYMPNESIPYLVESTFEIDRPHLRSYFHFQKQIDNMIELQQFATSPQIISGYLLLPLEGMACFSDAKEYKEVNFFFF